MTSGAASSLHPAYGGWPRVDLVLWHLIDFYLITVTRFNVQFMVGHMAWLAICVGALASSGVKTKLLLI